MNEFAKMSEFAKVKEFARSPSSSSSTTGNVKGTKHDLAVSASASPLPASSPRRQSTSALGFSYFRNPSTNTVPATSTFTHSTHSPARRNSNPTGSSSSGFCSYSPSESRTQSLELKCRRYSQPTSSSQYSAIADPLIKQEKASYSSLSFLPEVQTYLHFMEDTNDSSQTSHQRSNSFNGRNSLRTTPKKQRTRSQSRSPASGGAGGAEDEEEETCFTEVPPPVTHQHQNNRPYGQYLTPSRSSSMETQVQHHAPPTSRQMSLGNNELHTPRSKDFARRSPPGTLSRAHTIAQAQKTTQAQSPPTPKHLPPKSQTSVAVSDDQDKEEQKKEHDSANEDEEPAEPIFRRCFERRRSSTIRTSFI